MATTPSPEPTTAPYGSWASPITTDLLLAGTIFLAQPLLDGDAVYWIETRPLEAGRNVIVRWTEAQGAEEVTPPAFNARTRVHEYGGGDYTVSGGVIYFTNFVDQRLYRQRPGEDPEPLTPEGARRYADMELDPLRSRLLCVCEDHRRAGHEAVNSLVAVPLAGGEPVVLAAGNDFYSTPRLSPDGHRLAWLTWNHPNMPWDGTELWLADLAANGSLSNARPVAGGQSESIFQPEWSPGGVLHFISDRTGWWNLYRLGEHDTEALFPMEAEFGQPQWGLAHSTYAFVGETDIVCGYTRKGKVTMARLDTANGTLTPMDLSLTLVYASYGFLRAQAGRFVYLGASSTEDTSVVLVDTATGGRSIPRRASEVAVDEGYLSIARLVEFPTENNLTAYGYYYAPRNRDFVAPADELPPLIVTSHGGPTSATNANLSLGRQYWTSRGFAILDVDYGGSTGYGRPYRERLNEQWGVVDVQDCINGARWLVDQGLVDGERLIIRGGSAGGYTTLCAITYHDVFRAAASYFGVSDAEALAKDTHKFESRYTDRLIGPYPEQRERYIERSPIHVADRCSAALILFQGLDDEVVPPNQSEAMFVAARNRELPVAYITFEGEGHGFRQAQNIKRTLESELFFYSRVFGFDLAEPVQPVEIENL